jgi:hypothetical protein
MDSSFGAANAAVVSNRTRKAEHFRNMLLSRVWQVALTKLKQKDAKDAEEF